MAPNAGPLRSVKRECKPNVSREKKIIMTVCAVKLCHNTSEKQKKCDNITFHRIPTDPVIADKWVKNIRLSRGEVYWKPTKNTRICSKHFENEDKYMTPGGLCRLRRNAVPVKDLHISCTGTDDQSEDNVDEVSPLHGLSSINAAEDNKEEVPETSNRNLVIQSSSQPTALNRGSTQNPKPTTLEARSVFHNCFFLGDHGYVPISCGLHSDDQRLFSNREGAQCSASTFNVCTAFVADLAIDFS
ncbi:unnamed protein product [Colias eurytheme]|nr:unnamed protein product [Colias eurytheme]